MTFLQSKDIRKLIAKIYEYLETRRQMSPESIYQGTYEDLVIELNKELRDLTGCNYIDFPTRVVESIYNTVTQEALNGNRT